MTRDFLRGACVLHSSPVNYNPPLDFCARSLVETPYVVQNRTSRIRRYRCPILLTKEKQERSHFFEAVTFQI